MQARAANPIFVSGIGQMVDHNQIYVLTTNMHMYYWNGSEFHDTTLVYGTGAKTVQTYGESLSDVMSQKAVNDNTVIAKNFAENVVDLDTITYPCMTRVNATNWETNHLPINKYGSVITFVANYNNQTASYVTQMFVTEDDIHNTLLFIRFGSGQRWYKWHAILTDKNVKEYKPVSFYNKKVVLGGDSITAGVGGTGYAADGETIFGNYKRNPNGYCWAKLFATLLTEQYGCEVINNGCSGSRVNLWGENIDKLVPADTDVFILTIGTNDRQDDTEAKARELIMSNFEKINAYCMTNGIEFIACSPIPTSPVNEQIPAMKTHSWQINEFIKEACLKLNIKYCDLYNKAYMYYINTDAAQIGTYADNLHPNDLMYWHMLFWYCELLNIGVNVPYPSKPQ